MRSIKLFFMSFFILTGISSLYAGEINPPKDQPTLFQIEDKYNEIKLCLTKTSVYMQMKTSVKDYINNEIVSRHSLEANQFIDSQGHFLLGEIILLDSEKVEYSFEDIELVTLDNGKLSFKYHAPQSFIFEDILGTDGNPALENFYLEDLENFYMNYKKLVS